jgi:hypothetical protein
MKSIDHSEISGLMDGELRPDDVECVRLAMAGDEALQAEYKELAALDEDLKILAATVAFQPRISLALSPRGIRFNIPMLILAALILRLAIKMMPALAGCVIAMGVLALIVWGVIHLLKASDRERLILIIKGPSVQPKRDGPRAGA